MFLIRKRSPFSETKEFLTRLNNVTYTWLTGAYYSLGKCEERCQLAKWSICLRFERLWNVEHKENEPDHSSTFRRKRNRVTIRHLKQIDIKIDRIDIYSNSGISSNTSSSSSVSLPLDPPIHSKLSKLPTRKEQVSYPLNQTIHLHPQHSIKYPSASYFVVLYPGKNQYIQRTHLRPVTYHSYPAAIISSPRFLPPPLLLQTKHQAMPNPPINSHQTPSRTQR